MAVLLIVLPLAVLLAAVISQLGGNGRLPRNGFLGLRIPSTMSSDEAWQAGHRAAVVPAWIGFVVIAVVAMLSMFLFVSTGTAAVGVIVVGAIFVVTFVWLAVAASRAARTVEITD
jgi:uncharacterized membrane protein